MPFTADEIAHIKRIQDERGISYKSAVQYVRRLTKKVSLDIETNDANGKPVMTIVRPGQPNEIYHPVQHNTPDVSAPVDKTETILSDVPSFAGPLPTSVAAHVTTVGQAVAIACRKDAEANGDKWNLDKAVQLYHAGTKQIDIAEAMGYPRGKGQTRVRRALVEAGVWQGAH